MAIWQETFKIRAHQVDIHRRVRIPDLCQLMQEAAWNHAEVNGLGYQSLAERQLAWVLFRQLLRFEKLPLWGESIQVHTWSTGHDRLYWYREYKIVAADGTEIGRGTSTWFVMDTQERHPRRVSSYFRGDYSDSAEQMFPRRAGRVAAPEKPAATQIRQVRFHDLDMHGHANNIRYIAWTLESLPLAFLQSHALRELEINYLSEALHGDELLIHREKENRGAFRHAILRREDRRELCRAVTCWEPGK